MHESLFSPFESIQSEAFSFSCVHFVCVILTECPGHHNYCHFSTHSLYLWKSYYFVVVLFALMAAIFLLLSANHLVILITIRNSEKPITLRVLYNTLYRLLFFLFFCSFFVATWDASVFLIFITLKLGTCKQNGTKHQKQKWIWILFRGRRGGGKQLCFLYSNWLDCLIVETVISFWH